jgi:predicted nucleic acid-binding protein
VRVFVDSNIPMYVAGGAHENREPAIRFLTALRNGEHQPTMLCAKNAALGVRDAIHAAVVLNHDITHIATFDRAFDRVKGTKRLLLTYWLLDERI